MKQFFPLLFILIGFNSNAQFKFNSYEEATLKLRNGAVINGKAKITIDNKVKLKKGNEKLIYDYRSLDRFNIEINGEKVSYVYKIVAGKEPKLLKIIREYPGRVNLYVIENEPNSASYNHPQTATIKTSDGNTAVINTSVPSVNTKVLINQINEYYANKGDGHEVTKIGNDHPIFGKKKFKESANEFFKDCPEIIRRINKNEFRRSEMDSIVDFYNENCASS